MKSIGLCCVFVQWMGQIYLTSRYRTLVRPQLSYCMPACSPNLMADISYNKIATSLVTCIRHLPYEGRLWQLGIHSSNSDLHVNIVQMLGGVELFCRGFCQLPQGSTSSDEIYFLKKHYPADIWLIVDSNHLWRKDPTIAFSVFIFCLIFQLSINFSNTKYAPINGYDATSLWDYFALTMRRSSLFHSRNVTSIIKPKKTRPEYVWRKFCKIVHVIFI